MPLVDVKKRGSLYRLVDHGTNSISRTEAHDVPRDGGGHKSKAAALRQANYINNALKESRHY